MKKLVGKNALVTGSNSGIGQASAIEFAREGANVVIVYHTDKKGAEKTLRKIEAVGQRAVVYQSDVSDATQAEHLFEQAQAAFGALHILMNDAGTNGAKKPVVDLSPEEFEQTIRTNLFGPFYLCRLFARHRRLMGGQGKIINVTSIHEEIATPKTADYCASKGGLRSFTWTLALELAEDCINVNNLAPGMVLTRMNQEAVDHPTLRHQMEQNIPWKRAAKPEEIAKLALFLASDDANYVTGATYVMDGGFMRATGQGA
jgi:glucose 1-dehydrogenase